MPTDIHPQAIVAKEAVLDEGVSVGPFSVIEDKVRIGQGTFIGPGVLISGHTTIGQNCRIYKGAVIGSPPQDLKYKGEKSFLVIGNNNIIREFVTVNPGTEEGSYTRLGDNNLIMAYSHIAHNCSIGNGCILANGATLAGHVSLEDRVVIGGLAAIHQFCRLGMLSIVGGCSKVVQDIPPFALADGHPAKVRGINITGLKRAGFRREKVVLLRKIFKVLFFEGHTLDAALEIVKRSFTVSEEVEIIQKFITSSQRGIAK